jgi:hypothetical protein
MGFKPFAMAHSTVQSSFGTRVSALHVVLMCHDKKRTLASVVIEKKICVKLFDARFEKVKVSFVCGVVDCSVAVLVWVIDWYFACTHNCSKASTLPDHAAT